MSSCKRRLVSVTSALVTWRNLCHAGPERRMVTVHSLSRCAYVGVYSVSLSLIDSSFVDLHFVCPCIWLMYLVYLVTLMCYVFIIQDLVEKVVVLRRAVEETQRSGPSDVIGILLAEKMSQYANLLASQGNLTTAISYLPDDTNQVCVTNPK